MVRGPLDLHPGLVQVLRAGGPVPDQVVRASSVVPAWQATLTSRRSPSGCPPIGTHSFDSGPFTIRGAPPATRRHRHPLRAAALRQTGVTGALAYPVPILNPRSPSSASRD